MKSQLIAIIAAVLVVGCGPSVDIHEAAYIGNIEAVKQHLAAGTDVNAKIEGGVTPLFYAAGYGHKEIAELLIAAGPDVNAKSDDGRTPLLSAAASPAKGHKEIAELLIAKGADVNAKIQAGKFKDQTPLVMAIKYKHTELADLLRKHGAKTGEELKAEGK
ncbi:MAG: ankyrin repeat domain-containing protein [Verrucomicrobiota bacterium]|nr:ankyrin repeat domain-containing protein [Verrucomicrobiota bacterium]